MGTPLIILITAIISAPVGAGIYMLIATYITKNTIKKQCAAALKEAEAEGEMIKKEKILQAKEKFIQLKSEHDRQRTRSRRTTASGSRYRTSCRASTPARRNWRGSSASRMPVWNRYRA